MCEARLATKRAMEEKMRKQREAEVEATRKKQRAKQVQKMLELPPPAQVKIRHPAAVDNNHTLPITQGGALIEEIGIVLEIYTTPSTPTAPTPTS